MNRNLKDANISLVNIHYTKFCEMTSQINSLRNKRNEITKQIRSIKDKEEKNKLVEQAREIKEAIQNIESRLGKVEEEMLIEGLKIPNDTHEEVRVGGEEVTRIIKTVGTPLLATEIDHMTIGKELDLIDFETASIVTGTSWYYLRNAGALLELALIQYAMEKLVNKGYLPIITPDVIRTEFSNACGFQPRDDESSQKSSSFKQSNLDENSNNNNNILYQNLLSATAEIPLAGIYSNKILTDSQLPIRMVGYGKCFRAEAGSRGQDTKGLYRVHQFSKVEMFCLTKSHESDNMFNEIVGLQEEIFNDLGLCFRILDMPTYELGANAYRKFDMEAWMPGRGKWGEISSASNSIAVPRMIISILENFQRGDGKIVIPKVLRKWMNGMEIIEQKVSSISLGVPSPSTTKTPPKTKTDE
ncbi:11066_t:CDS:2, partial [Dentiscutata erythropus]